MASEDSKFAPLVPISNLSRFYWARFGFANEQICHGNKDDAIDTFYDLLLQPELSLYLRALTNASLAIHADSRSLADRAKWVKEAKRIHEDVKRWPKTIESDKYDGILQDTIKDAEEELRVEVKQLKDEDRDAELKQPVESDEFGSKEENEAATSAKLATLKDDVEMKHLSDTESEFGALPILPKHKKLDPHRYFPTPEPSSELGRNGNGNGSNGSNGHESNGSNGGKSG